MQWRPSERNRDGIHLAELRNAVVRDGKTFDQIYEEAHDALSEHYYRERDLPPEKRTPFIYNGINYGILDKEKFDKLHGLIFEYRHVALVEMAAKHPKHANDLADIDRTDESGESLSDLARRRIAEAKASGLEWKF